MIDTKILKKCEEFAYECLINTKVVHEEIKDYAKAYRYEHSLRVANNAIRLALDEQKRGKDVDILTCAIAGMLHDIGKFECYIVPKEHGLIGAEMARPFLETLSLTKKQIDDACYAIAAHSGNFKVYEYPDILEAHIVEEADDIDRYGMYRIYCQISDYEAEENTFQGKALRAKRYIEKLKRDYKKVHAATSLGEKEIKREIKLQIRAMNGYYKQMKNTKEF